MFPSKKIFPINLIKFKTILTMFINRVYLIELD